MLDTKIRPDRGTHAKKNELDVDRYFQRMLIDPFEPGAYEASLSEGPNGQVYLAYFQSPAIELMIMASADSGRSWGQPWHVLDEIGKPIKGHHVSLIPMSG